MLGKIKKTDRGFEYIHFQDHNAYTCILQQSNMAFFEQSGSSGIWLGLKGNCMHLNLFQVQELIEVLQNWVNTGSFDGDQ